MIYYEKKKTTDVQTSIILVGSCKAEEAWG